jgi:hypothetical protein
MQEGTAQLKVTFTVDLIGEPGANSEQPGVTAEDKATAVLQVLREQKAAIGNMYDTGVAVNGTVQYVGKVVNEAL